MIKRHKEAFLFNIKVSNGLVCAEMKISEVLKVVNEGRADKSRKELDTDFDESIKKYLRFCHFPSNSFIFNNI